MDGNKWIVSVYEQYYPRIKRFETYEEAKEFYDDIKSDDLDEDGCVYLSEVKEFHEGKEYNLI